MCNSSGKHPYQPCAALKSGSLSIAQIGALPESKDTNFAAVLPLLSHRAAAQELSSTGAQGETVPPHPSSAPGPPPPRRRRRGRAAAAGGKLHTGCRDRRRPRLRRTAGRAAVAGLRADLAGQRRNAHKAQSGLFLIAANAAAASPASTPCFPASPLQSPSAASRPRSHGYDGSAPTIPGAGAAQGAGALDGGGGPGASAGGPSGVL